MGSLNTSVQLTLITSGRCCPDSPCPLLCLGASPCTTSSTKTGLPRTQQHHPPSAPAQANPSSKALPFPAPAASEIWLCPTCSVHTGLRRGPPLPCCPASSVCARGTRNWKRYHSPLFSLSTTSLKSQGSSLPSPSFLKGSASRRETPFHLSLPRCFSCFLFSSSICMPKQGILTQIKSV